VTSERVDEVLDRTGMSRRAGDPVHELSRGMLQRLAVCRAVLHAPDLLLLDEPLANLDPAAVEDVEPLIGRPSGVTRVVTSHDPTGGLAEADVVLGLRGGRAELLARADEVQRADVEALYR
jgi:heme exporter protein A